MKKLLFAVVCALGAVSSYGEESISSKVAKRVNVYAYADIETAYWVRGAIVDKNPYSAQFADLSFDFDPFGCVGGYAWSVSSLPMREMRWTHRTHLNRFGSISGVIVLEESPR